MAPESTESTAGVHGFRGSSGVGWKGRESSLQSTRPEIPGRTKKRLSPARAPRTPPTWRQLLPTAGSLRGYLTACSPSSIRRRVTPPPLDQPWGETLIGQSYEARGPEPRPQRPHLVVVGRSAYGGGFGQVAFTELQISRPTSDRSGVGFSRLVSPPHHTVLGGQHGGTCNRRLT